MPGETPRLAWNFPASGCYTQQSLYDLEADPHEPHNLVAAAAYAQVRANRAETLNPRRVEPGEGRAEVRPAR